MWLNRWEVSCGGFEAFRRPNGEERAVKGTCFKLIMLHRRKALPYWRSNLTSLWEDGVYLGMRIISGDRMVGTHDDVTRTRAVQSKGGGDMWGVDAVQMVVACLGKRRLTTKKRMAGA